MYSSNPLKQQNNTIISGSLYVGFKSEMAKYRHRKAVDRLQVGNVIYDPCDLGEYAEIVSVSVDNDQAFGVRVYQSGFFQSEVPYESNWYKDYLRENPNCILYNNRFDLIRITN